MSGTGRRGEGTDVYTGNRMHAKGTSPGENSEVYLLPAFALPPRGVDDEKRQRRKGEILMPSPHTLGRKDRRNQVNQARRGPVGHSNW
jgi:hypothetical protein